MAAKVTWIFSGGEIQDEFVKDYCKKNRADQIIAVDGGLAVLDRIGLRPTYVVGDFDTIDAKVLEKYQSDAQIAVREFQPEKDLTDGQIAVELALQIGSTKILLFGATGKRLDHLLGNLHLLYLAEQQGVDCEILDMQNRVYLLRCGKTHYLERKMQFGTYLSFVPFTDVVKGITLCGFRYPLVDFTMTRFSNPTLGISNELVGEEGSIWFSEGVLICVESKD